MGQMKPTAIFSPLLFFLVPAQPQTLNSISLNTPNQERGSSLMRALEDRHSTRTFSPEMLSLQDLSDLLRASTGKNHPVGYPQKTDGLTGNH